MKYRNKTGFCQTSDNKEKQNEWIGAMLQSFDVEQDYYRSKYREPISDLPSKKNKEFAEALKEILV